MSSIRRTRAQGFWSASSPQHDAVVALLTEIEGHGRVGQQAFAKRVAVEADRLALEQPRDRRVSRADLEEHAAAKLLDQHRDEMRTSARALRQRFESALSVLKQICVDQRRDVRAQTFPGADARMDEVNARLELANFSPEELLAVAADKNSTPARRYVSEQLAGRALKAPVVHPEFKMEGAKEDAVLRHQRVCRDLDEKRAQQSAALAAIENARVPARVQAREQANDRLIAAIETRWARIRSPFQIATEQNVPMPPGTRIDREQADQIASARKALEDAVRTESLVEAGYVEVAV